MDFPRWNMPNDSECTYTAAEVAELKAQCAAMLEKAAAVANRGECCCDVHDSKTNTVHAYYCPKGIARIILALIPTDHAAALEEVKRQARLEALNEVMEYVQKQRQVYADIASDCNRRGMEVKKLSAECRELSYLDVMKEIEHVAAIRAEGAKL